ncbi:MAG: hypothetical protein WCY23_04295 [Candidatus Omnitrophota bacterium]
MNKQPTRLSKIFGSGPFGLAISIILFFVANWLNKRIDLPLLSNNRFLLNSIFLVSILMTLAVIIWSVKSLPTADRGGLCDAGTDGSRLGKKIRGDHQVREAELLTGYIKGELKKFA